MTSTLTSRADLSAGPRGSLLFENPTVPRAVSADKTAGAVALLFMSSTLRSGEPDHDGVGHPLKGRAGYTDRTPAAAADLGS